MIFCACTTRRGLSEVGRSSLVVLLPGRSIAQQQLVRRAQWRINKATLQRLAGVVGMTLTVKDQKAPIPEEIPSELGGSILSLDITSESTQQKSCQ